MFLSNVFSPFGNVLFCFTFDLRSFIGVGLIVVLPISLAGLLITGAGFVGAGVDLDWGTKVFVGSNVGSCLVTGAFGFGGGIKV